MKKARNRKPLKLEGLDELIDGHHYYIKKEGGEFFLAKRVNGQFVYTTLMGEEGSLVKVIHEVENVVDFCRVPKVEELRGDL